MSIDASTDTFNQVSNTIKGAVNTLNAAAHITGNDIKHAMFVALDAIHVLPAGTTEADIPLQLYSTDGVATDAEQIHALIAACDKAASRRDSAAINRNISNENEDGFGIRADLRRRHRTAQAAA